MTDAIPQVLDQLTAYGLQVERLDTSGQPVRCRVEGDRGSKRSGWYVLHELLGSDGRARIFGSFCNWKLGGELQKVCINSRGLSEAERADLKRRQAEAQKAVAAERHRLAEQAAERAERTLPKLPDSGRSPYLDRKRVRAFGCRFARGTLVVPMRHAVGGPLVGLQWIAADGSKRFLTGTAKQGAFHFIGERVAGVVAVAEGYATGATIHQATGCAVAVAFDAGNLKPVCLALRKAFPSVRMVICADDDFRTDGNPGLTKARAAAKTVNGVVAVPAFTGEKRGTDWNDLHVAEGLETVRSQLSGVLLDGPPSPGTPTTREQPETAGVREAQAPAEVQDDSWQDGFLVSPSTGAKVKCQYNVGLILRHDERWLGVLGYSDLSYEVMKRCQPPHRNGALGIWHDGDTAAVKDWLGEHYSYQPGTDDILNAVLVEAQENRFHPFRDYLASLNWDGVERLDTWLMVYLGADPEGDERKLEYLRIVGARWVIGAVARAHARPGAPVKMDNVLILEGRQRAGKSTAVRVLAGDEFFSDSHFVIGALDGYQFIRGLIIVELAELDSFNKAGSAKPKMFFSSSSDRYRPSYGRTTQDWPRQCVFVGTTNQDSYLKDPTGNERYWPVRVGTIDIEALRRDRDQLWAEAYQRYRDGAHWHVTRDEQIAYFGSQQEERFQSDAWMDYVDAWLSDPSQRMTADFTTAEIMEGALGLRPEQMRQPEQTRVGLIMSKLGWKKRRISRDDGTRPYVYERPES